MRCVVAEGITADEYDQSDMRGVAGRVINPPDSVESMVVPADHHCHQGMVDRETGLGRD